MAGGTGSIHADFLGSWAGSAPLTWGQRHIWDQIQRLGPNHHFLNSSYPVLLPDRADAEWATGREPAPDTVVRALADLITWYEALRTRVRVVDGEPEQVVARAGRITLEIVESTAADAADDARAAQRRLYATPFEYATDLPVRAAAVTVDGWVTHVVLCVSHLSVDGAAALLVMRQLYRRIVGGVATVPSAIQPVDLTRRQAGSGRIRRAAPGFGPALTHWASAWRRIPPAMFTPAHPAVGPPFVRLRLDSAALYGACRLVAGRQRVSVSTVLVAATMSRIAAVTGHDECAMLVHSGNRFQPAFTSVVGTMSQRGLIVLDLRDRPSFDTVVRRSFQASLNAYRHAYYDQAALDAELARICRERGVEVHPHCCFNNRRAVRPGETTGVAPAGAGILASLDDTRVSLAKDQPAEVDCRFCLDVIGGAPAGQISLVLTADTRCLPPDAIDRFLRDLERDVVRAACGQLSRTPG